MCIAVGGEHFEDAVLEFEDRDVEGAATEIVDGYGAGLTFVEAIGEGGGGWFVDETEYFETGDASGVFGGLALRVVEVCGDRNDGLGDRLTEEGLGVALELEQDTGTSFGWSDRSIANLERSGGLIHEALGGIERCIAVRSEAGSGGIAGHIAAIFEQRDHAGHNAGIVRSRDDVRSGEIHEGGQTVGCAKVYADDAIRRSGFAEVNLKGTH